MPSVTNSPPASAAEMSEGYTAGAESAFSPNASIYLRISAHLGRLALHASARAADEFWPPPEISKAPTPVVDRNASSLTEVRDDVHMIGDERPLISIVAEGGLLRYQQVPPSCYTESSQDSACLFRISCTARPSPVVLAASIIAVSVILTTQCHHIRGGF